MPKECCKHTWSKVADDEPVFIIRGQDALAVGVIADWIKSAVKNGVDRDKIESAARHMLDVLKFQRENPDRVKRPD